MKVAFADNHVMFRDGLRPFLNTLHPGIEIHEAGTYAQLYDILEKQGPIDLCLADLRMPDAEPLEGIRGIRERGPQSKVAVLSPVSDRRLMMDVLALGASGFIPKRLSIEAMMSALKLVMSGEVFVPAAMLVPGAPTAGGPARAGRPGLAAEGGLSSLTSRERQVLRLLREGMPNKAIARHLDVSEVTVKSHLCRVFRKLGVQNRIQAARASLQAEDY